MSRTEYLREWVKKNPDKVALNRAIAKLKFYLKPIEEQREHYRKRNAKKSKEQKQKWVLYHREWQWKKNGIKGLTQKIYEQTLKKQKNKCKICKEDMTKPHADHDHKTGYFRALLCAGCNLAYGRFEKFKERFIKYDT